MAIFRLFIIKINLYVSCGTFFNTSMFKDFAVRLVDNQRTIKIVYTVLLEIKFFGARRMTFRYIITTPCSKGNIEN